MANLLLEQILLGLYILQQDVEAFEVRCSLQLVVQVVFDTGSSQRKLYIRHIFPNSLESLSGKGETSKSVLCQGLQRKACSPN